MLAVAVVIIYNCAKKLGQIKMCQQTEIAHNSVWISDASFKKMAKSN